MITRLLDVAAVAAMMPRHATPRFICTLPLHGACHADAFDAPLFDYFHDAACFAMLMPPRFCCYCRCRFSPYMCRYAADTITLRFISYAPPMPRH